MRIPLTPSGSRLCTRRSLAPTPRPRRSCARTAAAWACAAPACGRRRRTRERRWLGRAGTTSVTQGHSSARCAHKGEKILAVRLPPDTTVVFAGHCFGEDHNPSFSSVTSPRPLTLHPCPLLQMCADGDIKMLKSFLASGLAPDSHDYDGRTGAVTRKHALKGCPEPFSSPFCSCPRSASRVAVEQARSPTPPFRRPAHRRRWRGPPRPLRAH